jgi:hypothetical protein
VTALLAAGLSGCAGANDRGPAAEVTDSAGIRIVTYDLAGITVPTYRTVTEHDLEIGALDGAPEYAFSRVATVAVTDVGAIVVSDAVAQELRVYGADGTYVRTLGRRGDGPGEFASPPLVADVSGDTVFAFDPRSARVSLLSLGGELLGEVSLRSEAIGRPESVVRHGDGTYVVQAPWIGPSAASTESYELRAELDSVVVLHVDGRGTLLDTLRVMADRTRARSVENRGSGILRTLQAPTPYGARAYVRAGGPHILVARSDAVDLRFLDPAEERWTFLRVSGVEHTATAADILAHQEAALREDFGDEEIDPFVLQVNTAFLPDRLPAFTNVLVTEDGDVWMALAELDASAGYDWLVFSGEDELRGVVHTPPDLLVHDVGRDFVVGVVTDELDVPYVRRYPLREATEPNR